MYESEKGFLERIADRIPGVKGYREKESRRDTDKRLRDYMAAELDRHRRAVDEIKRALLSAGNLDLLDDADRAVSKLQKCADALRYASYGYSGFFDQVKIGEAELDRLYEHDSKLLGLVQDIPVQIAAAASEPVKGLGALATAIDTLSERIEARKHIFNQP